MMGKSSPRWGKGFDQVLWQAEIVKAGNECLQLLQGADGRRVSGNLDVKVAYTSGG